ncbi:raffinose/stachyose/melibiose transport system permease protein [Arthrobacter sp. 31Cvi3.1E]|nr:raffinose/stachyose/melibiose transport system permease protein [Arthrobacter sp. 31Cvi3.1E]
MQLKTYTRNLLWVLPAILLIGVFLYYPLLENLRLSLYSWSVFSPEQKFVGLDNFRRVFEDPVFLTALLNNIAYAVVSLIVQVGLGLVLASVIDLFVVPRFQGFFRSVYFLPATLSITITGVLFTFIYHPDVGLLNSGLRAAGLGDLTTTWLGEPSTAIWAVILMSQWQWTGYVAALLLVAIQRIPRELYEASSLDGASRYRQFWAVTVPLTREMVAVMSIVTLGNAFLVFNEIIAMTNGGPNNATEVLGTMIYRSAFTNDDMGYAAAISTIVLLITLTITMVQMYYTRKKRVTY